MIQKFPLFLLLSCTFQSIIDTSHAFLIPSPNGGGSRNNHVREQEGGQAITLMQIAMVKQQPSRGGRGGRGGGETATGGRGRGGGGRGKSVNKSNDRKAVGYSYRNEGIKMKRKKPQKWEVEGDALFFLPDDTTAATTPKKKKKKNSHAHVDEDSRGDENSYTEIFKAVTQSLNNDEQESKQIHAFLKLVFETKEEEEEKEKKGQSTTGSASSKSGAKASKVQKPSLIEGESQSSIVTSPSFKDNMMWGTIPIGPILKSKIASIYDNNNNNNNRSNNNNNNDQSHPTPIQEAAFKILSKKQKQNVVIASPTGSGKTLAYLLPLLATSSKKDERQILIVTPTLDLSMQIQKVVDQLWGDDSVYVLKNAVASSSDDVAVSSKQIMEWNIQEMIYSKAPIIASTPRNLLQMASAFSSSSSFSDNTKFKSLFSNLKTIVLDEADRLLQTELLARYNHEKLSKTNHKNNYNNKQHKNNNVDDSPTIQFLNSLQRNMGVSLNNDYLQQRQLKGFSNTVQLICASATVGRTLRHQIMDITNASSIEKGSMLVTADERTGKDATKRKSSLLPNTIQHYYAVIDNSVSASDDRDDVMIMIEAITGSMKNVEPGSSIIFPGRLGVQTLVNQFQEVHGFKDIKTLRDNDESMLQENIQSKSWKDTSIHVIGEKFARGLDIPYIQYVFISSPPTSPAAYAHLAGRTGRAGKKGIAITIVKDWKEAKRLVTLSNKLGIRFHHIDHRDEISEGISICDDDEEEDNDVISVGASCSNTSDDEKKSKKSAAELLEALTVPMLKEKLRAAGLPLSGRKVELIDRLTQNAKEQE